MATDANNGWEAGRPLEVFPPIPESPSSSKTTLIDNGRKKALLIGIRGTKTASRKYPELKGSHDDVASVRSLLIECYGYKSSDITTLIDDDVTGNTQPTRDNILRAIAELVNGAREGDHFCFHYSGHSTQIKNRSGSEEDGMDECIIPSDGEDNLIVDNELNASLVAPLPAGSQLVAVLDTCHSGTLLDLKHIHCNRVKITRRNACLVSLSRAAAFLASLKPSPPAQNTSTRMLARRSEVNMKVVCSPPTLKEAHPSGARAPQRTFTYRSRTVDYIPPKRRKTVGDAVSTLRGKFFPAKDECTSPVETSPVEAAPTPTFECTGRCREQEQFATGQHDMKAPSGGVKADVISLASCNDSQVTWEDTAGKTMTWSLVQILRRDPNQSLKDVFLRISRAMHTKALMRHAEAKEYETKYTTYKRNNELKIQRMLRQLSLMGPETNGGPPVRALSTAPTFPPPRRRSSLVKGINGLKQLVTNMPPPTEYDMSNVESPELSSARPLDMERRFTF